MCVCVYMPIPTVMQNTDWQEADSFVKNKAATFVQHFINFSWPNSKRYNKYSESVFWTEISPAVEEKVKWRQMSED